MAESFRQEDVEFVFSRRRKTISLEVREGRVQVRAPWGYPRVHLERLVKQKRRWIEEKIRRQLERVRERPSYRYEEGEALPYLGRSLSISWSQGPHKKCHRHGDTLRVQTSARSRKPQQEQVREAIVAWYREQALQVLEHKTRELCRRHRWRCGSVRVRATRSKWGHCTHRGDIQYNWQIILAPESVVDYLVAHEVSHLRYRHHGAEFWAQVARICPDYRTGRDWLRQYGHTLILPERTPWNR